MKLLYRHCLWCNGIFHQHKSVQKFCSDKCRKKFSENRGYHGGFDCGDPVVNTATYTQKPPKEVISQYPESSI